MDEFRFENNLMLTESQYVAVWSLLPPRRSSRIITLGAFIALAIVFLFTTYTLILGVLLLGLIVLSLLLPGKILSFGARSSFHKHEYLRDPLTYGVSEEKIWIRGARIDASVPWSMLATWREVEDWLVLSPSGTPPVYLSLAGLKEEGLYGRVRALAASNAPEYGTSSPRW